MELGSCRLLFGLILWFRGNGGVYLGRSADQIMLGG